MNDVSFPPSFLPPKIKFRLRASIFPFSSMFPYLLLLSFYFFVQNYIKNPNFMLFFIEKVMNAAIFFVESWYVYSVISHILELFSLFSHIISIKVWKNRFFSLLLHLSFCGLLAMSRWRESKFGLFFRERRLLTFSSDSSKIRDFQR